MIARQVGCFLAASVLRASEMILDKIKNIASAGAVAQGFLRPIDTNRIAREVDLEKKCNENGARNLPPPTATTLDSVEQDIVQRLEAEWAWQGDELLTQLRAYAHRLIGCSVDAEFEKLQVKGRDTLARLRAAHVAAERELGPRREAFIAYRDDLAAFKTRNRLNRPVRGTSRRITTIGLLIFLVAFESVINGAFFADAATHGLIGGIGIAIGISILNVALAYGLGVGPTRWLHHRNWLLKALGFLTLIAGVGTLFGLHGFALHLRDASADLAISNPLFDSREAMELAVQRIFDAPFTIHDLNSFYLFALGVVFAFLAFLKGYRSDDPYPGYGPHQRRTDTAREAYSDDHSDLFDELTAAKDETVKAIRLGLDHIPRLPQEADNIRASRQATLQKFRAYETSVETSINLLVKRYRDCNRSCRSEPVPAYFENPLTLPYRFADSVQVAELLVDNGPSRLDIADALRTLHTLLDDVLTEYENLLKAYPHPTQMA